MAQQYRSANHKCSGDVTAAYAFSKPGVRVQVPSGASGHLRSWREGHLTRAFDLWGRLTAHLGERLFCKQRAAGSNPAGLHYVPAG